MTRYADADRCAVPRCRARSEQNLLGLIRLCGFHFQRYCDMNDADPGSGRKWLNIPENTPEERTAVNAEIAASERLFERAEAPGV